MLLGKFKPFLRPLPILFILALASGAQTNLQQDDDDTEKVFTEEIKLNVSAFNEHGKFVPTVKKEDLVIIEDGRLHQPTSVRRIPANVLIVLDTVGELRQAKDHTHTRKTAQNLVGALGAKDSIAVLEYSDSASILTGWTLERGGKRSSVDAHSDGEARAALRSVVSVTAGAC